MKHSSRYLRSIGAYSLYALGMFFIFGGCDRSPSSELQQTDSGGGHKHLEPLDACYICDESLREAGRLWCRGHGRYEDRCFICHPDAQEKNRPYCNEHFLYEDECFICLGAVGGETHQAANDPGGHEPLFCNVHNMPELECGICQPQLAENLEPGQSMKIRFVSGLSASKAGVRTALPQLATSAPTITGFCQAAYNQNELARITPLAAGVIQRVLVDVGSEIRRGDVLLEIQSNTIAEAKAAFLVSVVDQRVKELACLREQQLAEQDISAVREYQEADALCKVASLTMKTARQKLLNYGFTEAEVSEIEKSQDSSAMLRVRAPFEGTLVERQAVVGEAVEPSKVLFTLANLADMWLDISISAQHIALMERGFKVEATFADLPGVTANGKLVWIDASIDKRSRMIKARAIVENPGRILKAGIFGEVKITVDQATSQFHVPRDALQRYQRQPYLFVKLADDLYALRRITVGSMTDATAQVIAGIGPDDQVVVAGGFTVMSEFLKSRLGAGCVDH